MKRYKKCKKLKCALVDTDKVLEEYSELEQNSKDYEAIRRNLHDKQILQKAFERLVDVNFELRLAIEKKDLLLKIYSYLKKRIHFWGHKIKLGVRRIKL